MNGVHMMAEDFGAKFQKSSIRNDDICNELVMSRDDMRFDQKEKDQAARRLEQTDLMREAEAALAQTNAVLQTRKDALLAKHVEGRESLHELDYIFKDPRFEEANTNPDVVREDNFLEQHH